MFCSILVLGPRPYSWLGTLEQGVSTGQGWVMPLASPISFPLL